MPPGATIAASSGQRRWFSKNALSRRNALRAVLTSWAVCRILRPSTTSLNSSMISRMAFLPFWRGTESPHRPAASLPSALRPSHELTMASCHGSAVRPYDAARKHASSPSVHFPDRLGSCLTRGSWLPGSTARVELIEGRPLLRGSGHVRRSLSGTERHEHLSQNARLLSSLAKHGVELDLGDTPLIVHETKPKELQDALAGDDLIQVVEPVRSPGGLFEEYERRGIGALRQGRVEPLPAGSEAWRGGHPAVLPDLFEHSGGSR